MESIQTLHGPDDIWGLNVDYLWKHRMEKGLLWAQKASSSTTKSKFSLNSVAIEVSSRPKLTGIVRGKHFYMFLRGRRSRKRTR
ncbi:hypothetical protein TNCV_4894871 [Trichonephila clavipes]|nr:hypothetical protein TNCV_4894871 [Trichonephila clavipes]